MPTRTSDKNHAPRRDAEVRRVRMDRTKGHARTHPQIAPNSPWLCAVARATRVHRAELSQRGRARRATNHAGSARANTTSGPAPLLSPPGNRRSLLSGAKRRQWKSQNTPPTGTDATCASPASVLHRDSQPRLKSASERATNLVGVLWTFVLDKVHSYEPLALAHIAHFVPRHVL